MAICNCICHDPLTVMCVMYITDRIPYFEFLYILYDDITHASICYVHYWSHVLCISFFLFFFFFNGELLYAFHSMQLRNVKFPYSSGNIYIYIYIFFFFFFMSNGPIIFLIPHIKYLWTHAVGIPCSKNISYSNWYIWIMLHNYAKNIYARCHVIPK